MALNFLHMVIENFYWARCAGGGDRSEASTPSFVDFSLENLIKFEDEGLGHQFMRNKVVEQRRKRPNYDNTGRRLMARIVEREKQLV